MASTTTPKRSQSLTPSMTRSSMFEGMKRWDGAEKSCSDWDGLKKDPELWFRQGNCFIHLYGKGQSRRGPSFRVPFNDLLGANCFPLIDRFMAVDGYHPAGMGELKEWHRRHPRRVIDLYIPPLMMADKDQAYQYHLATRNFLAFVFRRPLVGEQLGTALIGLLYIMKEMRSAGEDNVEDMMDYLDEQGYLDLTGHPNHALAMLHFAEFFQLRELYTRAFAHCVGMSDFLFTGSEYWHASLTSRKHIRLARHELDSRIFKATEMLSNFLDDELSESYLGIPDGSRDHMERFRSFLLSFYSTQLGYYPPRAFSADLLASMRDDFRALFELLVDDAYSASEIMPSVAAGGICTLQLVQSFDARNKYEPMKHPLPLLPSFSTPSSSRRRSWLPRSDRIKPEERFLAHAALIKASNWREDIFRNDLVRAYRRFEEQSVVAPIKADKQEKVSVMDARKIRWILVYSTYQVLRSVTEVPDAMMEGETADYHLSVSTRGLPPWRTKREKPRMMLWTQPGLATVGENSPAMPLSGRSIDIRPDVDYFALTHPAPESDRRESAPDLRGRKPSIPSRTSSLSRALSLTRDSTIRRSKKLFSSPNYAANSTNGAATAELPRSPRSNSKPLRGFHEIVVQGYGNGTNKVKLNTAAAALATTESTIDEEDEEQDRGRPRSRMVARSDSTGSNSDMGTDSGPESLDSSSADSADSHSPSPVTPVFPSYSDADIRPLNTNKRRDAMSLMVPHSLARSSSQSLRRPVSTICESTVSNIYSDPYTALVEEQMENIFGGESDGAPPTPPPRSIHRQSLVLTDLKRPDTASSQPRIREDDEDKWRTQEWATMQSFMEADGEVAMTDADVKPAWEQYADLGGLTSVR